MPLDLIKQRQHIKLAKLISYAIHAVFQLLIRVVGIINDNEYKKLPKITYELQLNIATTLWGVFFCLSRLEGNKLKNRPGKGSNPIGSNQTLFIEYSRGE